MIGVNKTVERIICHFKIVSIDPDLAKLWDELKKKLRY